MVQAEWRTLLEDAVDEGRGANWLAWLHLGVMRYHAGEYDGARHAWEMSLAQTQTAWASRNLAVLAREEKRFDDAAEQYVAALRMRPFLLPLAVECGRALVEMGRSREWLDLLAALPQAVRTAGRIRLLEGQAALAIGDLERVERLFAEKLVIDDLREGERSLSHLWFAFHEQRLSAKENVPIDDALRARVRREFPVPREIDFRMSADTADQKDS
jgi:tetratricopeptide (TPR) repeat protein